MAKGSSAPATKGDVKKIVTEVVIDASETILSGVQRMFDAQNKKIGEIDERLVDVENEVVWLRRDMKDIKIEFANTSSRKEFNKLKSRVDRYHPSN